MDDEPEPDVREPGTTSAERREGEPLATRLQQELDDPAVRAADLGVWVDDGGDDGGRRGSSTGDARTGADES